MESTRALNRETLYAASKELEHAAKNRGKPAKKEKKAAAAVGELEEEEEEVVEKTKGDKKRKASSSPAEAGPSSNGVTKTAPQPSSSEKGEPSKKAKKAKAAAATAAEPAPAAPPAGAEELPSTSSGSKKNKKKRSSESGPAGDVTPIVSPTTGAIEAAADAQRRKSVRFSLKRNLVMTIGQPPLPEDIRTPPTSKPKGSALKVKVNMHRHVGSALGKPAAAKRLSVDAPASAPPKYNTHGGSGGRGQGNRKGRSPVGTRSTVKSKGPAGSNGRRNSGGGGGRGQGSGGKRPRASDFF